MNECTSGTADRSFGELGQVQGRRNANRITPSIFMNNAFCKLRMAHQQIACPPLLIVTIKPFPIWHTYCLHTQFFGQKEQSRMPAVALREDNSFQGRKNRADFFV